MYRNLIFVLVGLLMAAGVARADVGERKDLQVARDVVSSVDRYAHFTIFDDVNIMVYEGVVTLTGRVTMPYKSDAIEKRVARVDGVRDVRNQISVLPVSLMDDQLRYRIARAVYGNRNLRAYGIGPSPSIHIIVEHGRVRLTGVVTSDI